MRRGLESVKPLDADVEKDGAKEIKYDKAILDSIRVPSDGIAKAIAESEIKEKPRELWNASDLAKYTIGTPIQEKQGTENIEQSLELAGKEFEELAKNIGIDDAELQAEYEQMAEELESIF